MEALKRKIEHESVELMRLPPIHGNTRRYSIIDEIPLKVLIDYALLNDLPRPSLDMWRDRLSTFIQLHANVRIHLVSEVIPKSEERS